MRTLVRNLLFCSMFAELVCAFQSGDVRLVDGDSEYDGRVEIFLNGEWGTINDDPWNNEDAGVVCRQLGFTLGGVAHIKAYFGQGNGPVWHNNITCSGREENLLNCFNQNLTSQGLHSEDVGVACYGKVRLVNGNGPDEGRVEIFMNGQWGTVDEDPWNDLDAGVVCRQLGYLHGGVAFTRAYFGQGNGPIWLDDVKCVGNEQHLMSCDYGTDTSEDTHKEDVGVKCAWPVRLANGSRPSEGRVEVLINGNWGTINSDNWDNRDASVVCSQLGYPAGGTAYAWEYFGKDEGPTLLENLNCVGTETSLFHCPLRKVSEDRGHSRIAGVACYNHSSQFCSSQLCTNNGKPDNGGTGFRYTFSTGVAGIQWENGSDPCNSSNCKNSTSCVQLLNYRYCTCQDTYNVTVLCQYEIGDTSSNPCKEQEVLQPREDSFDCAIAGRRTCNSFESMISYVTLVLAICATLAAAVCLVKIYKIQRLITQQGGLSSPFFNDNYVQVNFEHNKVNYEEECTIRYNKI